LRFFILIAKIYFRSDYLIAFGIKPLMALHSFATLSHRFGVLEKGLLG